MDTMLILHVTLLLVVAVVSSYSDNKTSSVGSTISDLKIIDVKNIFDDDSPTAKSKRGLEVKNSSIKDTTGFSKRQDPSFSSSLTSFDEPSSIINSDSVSGFSGGKSPSKDVFDIDDIDIQSNPSFDIDGPSIKGGSSFSIKDPNAKDPSSFDIDTPSFSLEGASFNIDAGGFNLDIPTFAADGDEVKDNPLLIDVTDFEVDEPPAKSPPRSFESDFHNAKRSSSYNTESIVGSIPSYNVESPTSRNRPYKSENDESESYKPEASSIRSTSVISPIYNSVSKKNYNYPKSSFSRNTTPKISYAKVYISTSPEAAYSKSRIQYVGSLTNPNSQIYDSYSTTPYYENYVTPLSSGSKADRSKAISNIKYAYSNSPEASTPQKIQGHEQGQNSFKNSLFTTQGTFGGYPAFQNLNSFSQGGFVHNSGSQATQTPIYQSQYPGPKNSQQAYSPTHQTLVSFSPSTQSFGKLSHNLAYTSSPLEFSKRATSLPVIQIQNAQGFPGFIQSLEAEPLLLTTRSHFQTLPNFEHSLDYGKESGNRPFLSSTDSYQLQQVIPVQTSSSTPQFPKYKGASIEEYSRSDVGKQPGSYQPLANQPQLHFNANSQSANRPRDFPIPKSFERIKEDVEIIKNKKSPQDDDNEEEEEVNDDDNYDSDEGYKSIEQEYDQSNEDERSEPQSENRESDSSERYSGEELEFRSMSPMPPFVFKPYDEKVGRLHEFVRQPEPENRFSEDASAENIEEDPPKTYIPTYSPVTEYSHQASRPYFGSTYGENDDESEIRRYAKQEDKVDFPFKGREALRSDERRYESNIDDSHRKESLQNKYSYDVRQSPAEDRTTFQKNSKYPRGRNLSPKTFYRNSFVGAESVERSIKAGTKKPINRGHKNSEEQKTITGFKIEPRVIYEESFGYKIPKKEERKEKMSSISKAPIENSYARLTKDNDDVERYSNMKKAPSENSYIQTKRGSYESNSPKNGDSYLFSSGKNRKSYRKSPEVSDSQSHPSQQTKNVAYITEDDYNFFSPERIRPGLSGSIF